MWTDKVCIVKIHIIKASFKIKRILDQLNPYVSMWSSDQRPGYSTTVRLDEYIPFWDEEFEFTLIRADKKIKLKILDEQIYPKYKPLTDTIEIPVGQIGDHVDYDGPVYLDEEEVGTFNYEVDFLPLEYSEEIEDKYRREMEEKQREEEKQKEEERKDEEKRKEEERRRREEEERRRREEEERRRKEEEQKRKREEEPQRKMVSMPYRKIRRMKAGQDERDWEWARKYYEA